MSEKVAYAGRFAARATRLRHLVAKLRSSSSAQPERRETFEAHIARLERAARLCDRLAAMSPQDYTSFADAFDRAHQAGYWRKGDGHAQ